MSSEPVSNGFLQPRHAARLYPASSTAALTASLSMLLPRTKTVPPARSTSTALHSSKLANLGGDGGDAVLAGHALNGVGLLCVAHR